MYIYIEWICIYIHIYIHTSAIQFMYIHYYTLWIIIMKLYESVRACSQHHQSEEQVAAIGFHHHGTSSLKFGTVRRLVQTTRTNHIAWWHHHLLLKMVHPGTLTMSQIIAVEASLWIDVSHILAAFRWRSRQRRIHLRLKRNYLRHSQVRTFLGRQRFLTGTANSQDTCYCYL